MLRFTEELHTLLAAPYPVVELLTYEEPRVLGMLRSLAGAMQRALHVWRPEEHAEPGAALDAWLEESVRNAPGAVLVAVDAHPYLSAPARVRRLRVLAGRMAAQGSTLALVSPVAVHAPELAKDWVSVSVPLPEHAELVEVLEEAVPTRPEEAGAERLATAALGLTRREAQRAFERAHHLAGLAAGRRQRFDWDAAVIEEKRRLMASASALEFTRPDASMADVGGLDVLKQWVSERGRAFTAEARAFGLPQPRGLLLVGVQGCGKSLAAKAVAATWSLPLLRLDLGALFSGQHPPDVALRAAVRSAEAMAPCVLWVDEVEKGFGGDDPETARVLGSLLIWLQEKRAPVFFVATANQVTALPPELLRRGRFDELFFVDLPDVRAREAILDIHLARRGRAPEGFDTASVAALAAHFSGAELEQVVVAALYRAFARERELTQDDLVVAARQLVPLYQLRETEVKELRTWAKDRARSAGHDRKLADLFG